MSILRKILAATIVASISIQGITALAGAMDDAIRAVERKDYAVAMRLFRSLADQGNDQALTNLGVMYYSGWGVKQNYPEALRLFKLAADRSNENAYFHLGLMHDRGEGVPQNDRVAFYWYQRAAFSGVARAQNHLATYFEHGITVPQSFQKAYIWYSIAASKMHGEEREFTVIWRDRVASKLSRGELIQAQDKAKICLESKFSKCE